MLPHRLTCLGHPRLVGPDGEPIRVRTRKHLALLIWLAVEPARPHRRDRLASLLWPLSPREQGRHSLTTALSLLRGKLGPTAFDTNRETVRLVPGHVVTDLEALEGDDPLEGDSIAVGPFLDEFEIPDAPEFQQWIDVERVRLLPLLHRHLARRIERCRQAGESEEVGELARHLERIDPLSERAARALLESRAMAGDRLGALRGYEFWCRRLAEELGAVPSSELERIAERLRRCGGTGANPGRVAPVTTSQWKERVFIGRGEEHRRGYEVWQRAREGESAHLLVRGDSGIGKTTLIDRLATSIALEGASVARIQCYELERELPFGMIGTLVNQLLDLPGASATPPAQLAELGRLVGKVAIRWPNLPAPSTHTGESARIQLTEAVMALIDAIADEQPVVLLLDDIHLADATSLAVLHLILRRVTSLPLMAVLTAASDTGVIPESARRFVDRPASVQMTPIHLTPLTEGHAAELLDALLEAAADPGPTLRRALLAGSRGNPMILELLVADWVRQGDASLVLSISSMTLHAGSGPRHTFHRLVDGMLTALDDECRSVANLGAILGQRLNDLAMYGLVDLPVARTMRALSTLTSHRILRDAGTHLEFANEMVRGQCYVAMAAPLRRMLHSMVADRLLAQERSGEAVPGLEIAWHLVRGDRLPEAVPHLLAGGRESIRRGAPHEADLALSTGLPGLKGDARRQAVLLLAEALQELGRWGESLRVLEMGGEEWSGDERDTKMILTLHAQVNADSAVERSVSDPIAWLIGTTRTSRIQETQVRAATAALAWLNRARRPDRTCDLADVLDSVPIAGLDTFSHLHLRLARAWLACNLGHWQQGLNHLRLGVALAHQKGWAGSIVVRLLVGYSNTLSNVGRYEEAQDHADEAYRLASRLGNPALLANAAAQLAMIHGRTKNPTEQVRWAERGLTHDEQPFWSPSTMGLCYELGLGYASCGKPTEAVAAAERLLQRVPGQAEEWMRQAASLCGADIFALSGQNARAYSLAEHATENGLLDCAFLGQFARWRTLLALRHGDFEKAIADLLACSSGAKSVHAKDRAELGAAIAILRQAIGLDVTADWQRVQGEFGALPRGVPSVMRQLGLLPLASGTVN
jgi:DNA-binding SARP family transcriptional activator/tetratricopeptide (TPR) repeat protein